MEKKNPVAIYEQGFTPDYQGLTVRWSSEGGEITLAVTVPIKEGEAAGVEHRNTAASLAKERVQAITGSEVAAVLKDY